MSARSARRKRTAYENRSQALRGGRRLRSRYSSRAQPLLNEIAAGFDVTLCQSGDPELVGEVLKVMQVLAEEGRTMIVVTHEMGFARNVSTHIQFLHQGNIEEEGAPGQVLVKPQSERLRSFLSSNLK